MKRQRFTILAAALMALVLYPSFALADLPASEVRDIGDRLELFVDDWLIDARNQVQLRLHSPIPREVALVFDRPWEGVTTGFVTVMKDGPRYRCYYSNDTSYCFSCYAESSDGIHWTRPKLGLVEYLGSRDNNIILGGKALPNFSPCRDDHPQTPPEQRYKALAGLPSFAYSSADGIRWKKMQEKPVIDYGYFDSQNVAFWDAGKGKYVAFLRSFKGGVRWVRTATSDDFLRWTPTRDLDFGKGPQEHLYTNAITPYFRAPHLYVGLPMRFMPERQVDPKHPHPGIADGVFLSSRDGLHFERRFRTAFIAANLDRQNWTDRAIIPAWGIVPTGPEEISVYWVEHYRHKTIRLRRGSLRPDGFASANAAPAGGNFTTRPLRFCGSKLQLNFATSAAGSIKVAVLDVGGAEWPGFGLADCPEIYGNALAHVVRWKKGADLAKLPQPVRLRFQMQDADLFALRFAP